jgi:hypothetical protein
VKAAAYGDRPTHRQTYRDAHPVGYLNREERLAEWFSRGDPLRSILVSVAFAHSVIQPPVLAFPVFIELGAPVL